MRKAIVIVFFSLCVAVEVSGAADKTRGSVKENPTLENTKEAKQADPVSASNSISSPFLGKLLVVPMDGSHWVGIKAIAQEMGRRGHQVTVVIPEFSMRMGPGKHYNTIAYPVPYDQAFIDHLMSLNKNALTKSTEPFLERIQSKFSQLQRIFNFMHITAEKLLFNTSLISHLEQQNFDAVLTDPVIPTGSLVARKLGIPTINLLRGIPCGLDMKSAGCPSPNSYVPRFFTGYTDRMNYKERIINTLVSLVEPLFCRLLYWKFDNIAYQFLEEEVGIAEVLSESDIWLQRIDFTLEFPRPLMPNIILVGGINCNVRNPLSQDLESWVSGEHGFVVFTLGSMVSDMPEEITSIFIEAFRQIPQKVIWRYTGKVPGNIPDNVKIMKWVPQNDLLAHPGARAFITHAGSHGLFEGLCHAVPMVMVPIGGDQPDNAEKMASRGAGVVLDITSVTTEIIIQGLNEVINDTRYKENVEKLSSLHKDRPIEPLNLSVYWTEFVMRHKGAKHLKAAVHGLNWFQYFCLDVLALMAAVVLVFVILLTKCMKVCFQKLGRKRKQD
ncbi:UDP-glucuronosyltransferase 1A1-like [Melanotaenia boesemani]|uniref:UDP-glucuronosyltransferase 1A1-like n=1 Tax=Melanotaenia boesemani TaxID=1250792 RepID=UPI001C05246B|nr:UDP-glucuronosyltransferase 1A1-like [Melanotaenia boesemani]